MADVSLQSKCLRHSWVSLIHAVLEKGLPQQHRCICRSMVRVNGIYNQGVFFFFFLLLDLVAHIAVKHSVLWGNKN